MREHPGETGLRKQEEGKICMVDKLVLVWELKKRRVKSRE